MKKEDNKEETHPSFGHMTFLKSNGKKRFYGSGVEHTNYISFKISGSTKIKELGWERYSDSQHKPIVRGRMSLGQFSEMVTNINSAGVPCTLEYIKEEKIDDLPIVENLKEYSINSFKQRMLKFTESLKDIKENTKSLVKKKILTKDDQKNLFDNIEYLTSEIENNIPYFIQEFQNQTDSIILEAKIEIENTLLHKVHTLGLQALDMQNESTQLKE